MMNRNSGDSSNKNSQQQQQQQDQQFGGQQQQFPSAGGRSGTNRSGSGNTGGGYANMPSVGFQGDMNARRYTLSASLGGAGGPSMVGQHQQVPIHGMPGGMTMEGQMMGNHSQRSHHSQQMGGGFRGDIASSSPNNSGMQGGGGLGAFGSEQLSPTHLAHRMSLGFHPMSGGSGASPGFGAMVDPMDLSGRGLAATGAPGAAGGSGGPATQADREEELLLNLLIARRQRGRMAGDKRGRAQPLAEELMRLRQNRAARGNLPSVPGMPPLFDTVMPAVGGVPPNMYPGMDYHMKSDMQQRALDMSERIDRSPGRFQMADARMSDLSDRGFKRAMGLPSFDGGGALNYQSALEMQGMEMPPTKKKRTHKKKPADMPRRPLSAYNLFFSEERERILKEIESKEKGEKKEGDEDTKDESKESKDEDKKKEEDESESKKKEEEKPKALMRPLIPSQKKRRPHRKTHGKISFQELARMVGERWKNLPEKDRKYYQDLAQEDMKRQKIAMEEYYARQNAIKGEPDVAKPAPESGKSQSQPDSTQAAM